MGKISKRGLGSLVSTRGLTVFASSLITRKVCSSQAQICHTFMEMFLNLIYFTVSYFIEILTSLFWFFSTVNFAFTLLLKTYVVLATKLSWIFKIFSLWRTVSFPKHQWRGFTNFQIQDQHKTFPKEHVTYSFWWNLQLFIFNLEAGSCQFLYKYELLLLWSGKSWPSHRNIYWN